MARLANKSVLRGVATDVRKTQRMLDELIVALELSDDAEVSASVMGAFDDAKDALDKVLDAIDEF